MNGCYEEGTCGKGIGVSCFKVSWVARGRQCVVCHTPRLTTRDKCYTDKTPGEDAALMLVRFTTWHATGREPSEHPEGRGLS